MGSCPGGIANLATAAARLGLRTGLVAGFGDDAYGDWMWDTLSGQEKIDLSASRRFSNFHSALTVSMAFHGDRGMVTHMHPLPESLEPDLLDRPSLTRGRGGPEGGGVVVAHAQGAGDAALRRCGLRRDRSLGPVRSFTCWRTATPSLPTRVEAMHYTRTDRPTDAVRKLAELVPLAVVTDGVHGSFAIDQATGEEAYCPAVPVEAIDPTGAGDVFAASILLGTLAGWPLQHRLHFAALTSSLAVRQFGGSLAAPGWGDVADWWRPPPPAPPAGDLKAAYVLRDYGFLQDLLPDHPVLGVRRAGHLCDGVRRGCPPRTPASALIRVGRLSVHVGGVRRPGVAVGERGGVQPAHAPGGHRVL